MQTLSMARWPILRDAILFFAGIAGIAHETLTNHTDRPQLLLLFAGMVGLPAFIRKNGNGGK